MANTDNSKPGQCLWKPAYAALHLTKMTRQIKSAFNLVHVQSSAGLVELEGYFLVGLLSNVVSKSLHTFYRKHNRVPMKPKLTACPKQVFHWKTN